MTDSLEFIMRTAQLRTLVDWALPAVPASSQLLVNRCFRVQVSPGHLQLAAAGDRLNVLADALAVITSSTGTAYLPAKMLKAILAEASGDDIAVTVKGSEARATSGDASWTLLVPGPTGHAGLPDLSAVEFRPFSRVKMQAALSAVRHAVGTDSGRPQYTQLSIAEAGGVMYACATDSAQFARVPVPGFPVPLPVPGAALGELTRLLSKSGDEDVLVADTAAHVVFRAGPVTLAAAKTPYALPDVGAFLAAREVNEQELVVDRAKLVTALRQVQVSASATTSAVALILADGPRPGLRVVTRDGQNSAEAPVPARWDGGSEVLVVNGQFLMAMIAACPADECTFKVGRQRGAQLAPLVLADDSSGMLASIQQLAHNLLKY